MKKHLQTLISYVLIISVLNGAFFNRIGSKIAERPYFTLVFKAISSVFLKMQVDNGEVVFYSKRFIPNNLPPNQSINFVKDCNNFYNNLVVHNQFAESSNEKPKIVFYYKNTSLSKAFKLLLIKPPC